MACTPTTKLLRLFYTSTYMQRTHVSSLPGCTNDVLSAELDVDLLVVGADRGPTVYKRLTINKGRLLYIE